MRTAARHQGLPTAGDATEQPRHWTPYPATNPERPAEITAPTRVCPSCAVQAQTAARKCPHCGWPYPRPPSVRTFRLIMLAIGISPFILFFLFVLTYNL